MHLLLIFLSILLFALLSTQNPLKIPWTQRSPANPSSQTTLTFLLKQQNLPTLESTFWDVSNPSSPNYANYLTQSQIASIIAPPPETLPKLKSILESHGGKEFKTNAYGDSLVATFSVSSLQRYLQLPFYEYEHVESGRVIIRTPNPHPVPQDIASFVELVHGTFTFPFTPQKASKIEMKGDDSDAVPGNAPTSIQPKSRGGQDLEISFQPRCKDGSLPTTTDQLCALHPPEIHHFQMQIDSVSDVYSYSRAAYANFPETVCEGSPMMCKTTVDAIPYYVPLNFSIKAMYEDLSDSSVGYYPYSIVSTPPVTPQTLWDHYDVDKWYVEHPSKVTQAVAEFEQQYYSQKDLDQFFSLMGLSNPATSNITVIGPNPQSQPGVEANLDMQYLMGVALNSPTTFWSIKANSSVEIDDILSWALAVGDDPNPPIVHSISYGMATRNVDKYLGQGYVARSNVEFQKLALRGLTIIISDGDSGAGDYGDPPMGVKNCSTRLNPDWPSESPYITAVGSTMLTPLAEPVCYKRKEEGGFDCRQNPVGEVGVSLDQGLFWTTGGGFSDVSSQPTYQSQAVGEYLQKGENLPPESAYNAKGRAYPDVSTVGHNLMVVSSGKVLAVDGTSASAPIFAGLVTLLNDVRVGAGLPPLGFINPLFYKIAREVPDAFYDVTVGYNRCSDVSQDKPCCPFGYKAATGWDAVSGLGTPRFNILKKAVLNQK